jgi:hypothetical protein
MRLACDPPGAFGALLFPHGDLVILGGTAYAGATAR